MARSKGNLTDAEKKQILRLKIELNSQGVPRDQWLSVIQEKLNQQRKLNHRKNRQKLYNKKGSRFGNLQKRIKRSFLKIFTRRMIKKQEGFSPEMMDQMLDMMEGSDFNPEKLMDQFMPTYSSSHTSKEDFASIPSTFIDNTSKSRKKMDVVFFDDEDEDNDSEEDLDE